MPNESNHLVDLASQARQESLRLRLELADARRVSQDLRRESLLLREASVTDRGLCNAFIKALKKP